MTGEKLGAGFVQVSTLHVSEHVWRGFSVVLLGYLKKSLLQNSFPSLEKHLSVKGA